MEAKNKDGRNSFEIKNVILEKIFEETMRGNNFRSRDFIIKIVDNPDYPQFAKLQLVQDKCLLLDNFKVGEMVNVSFNLKGRLWVNPKGEEVWLTNLDAWRIERAANASQAFGNKPTTSNVESDPFSASDSLQTAYSNTPSPGSTTFASDESGEEDDLPF